MDLESAIETAVGYLPESFDLSGALETAASCMPAQVDFLSAMKFMVLFAAVSLVLGVVGRVAMGKRSSMNHAVSSAIGILFVYALTIVIYTFRPWNLEALLTPLPFVTFGGEYLVLFPIRGMNIPALSYQVLSLVILSFLVNLLDTFIPKGKSILGWYGFRFVTVVLSMLLHLIVNWSVHHFLPDVLVTYAPVILLGILAVMLLMGILNLVLGVVLTMMNPIFGAVYTFLFSNIIGKQLTKAVISTALICGVFYYLDYCGYTIITITAGALGAYIPLALVLLILWYLVGHLL